MAKTQKNVKDFVPSDIISIPTYFKVPTRMYISVPHRSLSDQFETIQGQEQSVRKLFDDYVAGRLDPRQLGGGVYDSDDSDELDPLNTFGLTFEEASQITDAGRKAANEVKQRTRKVADHPRESNEHQEKEDKPESNED